MDYEKQALKFLEETKTEFKAEFLKHGKHFLDETETSERDIYKITLKRGERVYKFDFGQSIAESGFKLINQNTNQEQNYLWFKDLSYNKDREEKKLKKETMLIKLRMEILRKIGNLGCLKLEFGKEPTAYDVLTCLTKNEVGSFNNFCEDYGYDYDSIKAEKIYQAVLKEWENVKMLYTDEEIEKLQEIQ